MYINGCDNGRDKEGEGEGEGEGGEGVSVDVEVSMLAEGTQPRKHICAWVWMVICMAMCE